MFNKTNKTYGPVGCPVKRLCSQRYVNGRFSRKGSPFVQLFLVERLQGDVGTSSNKRLGRFLKQLEAAEKSNLPFFSFLFVN